MKIGILTFHRAHNYGAVLQCYALIQFLRSIGNEVYVIDYSSDYVQNCYKLIDINRIRRRNPIRLISKLIKEINLYKVRKVRAEMFNNFVNKHFPLLSISNIDVLDAVIVGSDQVWNTKLTHGFDDYYWGKFVNNKKIKLISYAASIEEFWEKEENDNVIKLLSKFKSISVREDNAAKYLQKLLPNKHVSVCVDPTLLETSIIWNRIVAQPPYNEHYLLVYQVRNSNKTVSIAKKIAKKLSLSIIYLSASVYGKNSKLSKFASPEQYLGLFKNSSFVVCTSFHGTVFSLVYEKPFVSVKLNDGKDSRVESLLSKCNGLDHFVSEINEGDDYLEKYHAIRLDNSINQTSCDYLKNL